MPSPFPDKTKPLYLERMNTALEVHGDFLQGMAFTDIELHGNTLIFTVKPTGICNQPPQLKAFTDIANILTLSGDTLKFEIVEAMG
ncbi:hypothetical protein QFX18_13150 [Saccharophagus degradans]|uniref:hypothetical protein n=1 Tax=Saccharophagus degradans TaxID=86304 RepID=UPI0024780F25|nr:hypothetical protein [Saccharophagus degradans]WGO96989.1 hypothetical protein QFX18_13150 [Saccharophagus degradans]